MQQINVTDKWIV